MRALVAALILLTPLLAGCAGAPVSFTPANMGLMQRLDAVPLNEQLADPKDWLLITADAPAGRAVHTFSLDLADPMLRHQAGIQVSLEVVPIVEEAATGGAQWALHAFAGSDDGLLPFGSHLAFHTTVREWRGLDETKPTDTEPKQDSRLLRLRSGAPYSAITVPHGLLLRVVLVTELESSTTFHLAARFLTTTAQEDAFVARSADDFLAAQTRPPRGVPAELREEVEYRASRYAETTYIDGTAREELCGEVDVRRVGRDAVEGHTNVIEIASAHEVESGYSYGWTWYRGGIGYRDHDIRNVFHGDRRTSEGFESYALVDGISVGNPWLWVHHAATGEGPAHGWARFVTHETSQRSLVVEQYTLSVGLEAIFGADGASYFRGGYGFGLPRPN